MANKLRFRKLTALAAVAVASSAGASHHPVEQAAWSSPEACAVIARGSPEPERVRAGERLLASFSRDWPAQWRSLRLLRTQNISPRELRRTVTDLACLSVLPGGEHVVAETSYKLFASHWHGSAAFDQLDEVARALNTEPAVRSAARSFHALMRFEADDPKLR